MSVAMQTPRPRSRTFLQRLGTSCLLAALLLVGVAGMLPAQAQEDVGPGYRLTATTDTNDTTATVVPITGTGETLVTVTVACAVGTVHDPTTPLQVRFEPQPSEEWVVLSVSAAQESVAFSPEECAAGGEKTVATTVTSTYSKDAPAFTTTTHRLVATLDKDTTTEVEWNEQVGFLGRYDARFDQAIWKVAPGEIVSMPMTIENLGNGPIRVSIELSEPTELKMALPPAIVVPSPLTRPDEAVQHLHVDVRGAEAAGYENQRDSVVFTLKVASVEDPSEVLEGKRLTAAIQTQGWDTGEAPMAGPLVVVGLLAGLVAGRRRQV